jgi:hypothetical protein
VQEVPSQGLCPCLRSDATAAPLARCCSWCPPLLFHGKQQQQCALTWAHPRHASHKQCNSVLSLEGSCCSVASLQVKVVVYLLLCFTSSHRSRSRTQASCCSSSAHHPSSPAQPCPQVSTTQQQQEQEGVDHQGQAFMEAGVVEA